MKKNRKKETKKLKKKKVVTKEKHKSDTANHIKSESSKDKTSKSSKNKTDITENGSSSVGPSIDMMTASQATMPMTREEWEKQESVMRRVYDQDTGRHRLIKGSGEVMEECVSRDRHRAINKAATQVDGEVFQTTVKSRASK